MSVDTERHRTSAIRQFRSHQDWLGQMAARFSEDVKDHCLAVHLDAGVNRHLSVRRPDANQYWYEIITWSGALAIRGDMGTFVFSRLQDMFQFFRHPQGYINPMYWAEKLQAHDVHGGHRDYSPDAFRQHVSECVAQWAEDNLDPEEQQDDVRRLYDAVDLDVLAFDSHEQEARDAVDEFRFEGARVFYDTWEWDLHEYTAQFLWCCHAIVHAIALYDAATSDNGTAPGVQTVPTGDLL